MKTERLVFRGPGALERALSSARAMRMGRPKKGAQAVGTAAKSLRLANDQWAALERLAEKREGPTEASLREIPPIKNGRFLGRGKEGLAKAEELFRARRRGRPAKGERAEGTVAKTVRLPQSTYDELVRLAEVQGISAHVALRKAVAKWIVEARKRVA